MEPSVPEDAIDARPNAFTRELAAGMRTHSMRRVPELEGQPVVFMRKVAANCLLKMNKKHIPEIMTIYCSSDLYS